MFACAERASLHSALARGKSHGGATADQGRDGSPSHARSTTGPSAASKVLVLQLTPVEWIAWSCGGLFWVCAGRSAISEPAVVVKMLEAAVDAAMHSSRATITRR